MNILIIGDWTIDQNWICGVQRSSISSRTGRIHLRGLNEKNGATEALCGAGATASVLHRAMDKGVPIAHHITGIGIWHISDTNLLTDMIHSADDRELQPSGRYARFSPERDREKESVKLINLAELEHLQKIAGTTRIVRIYQHTGSKVDLLSRIDWENPLPAQKAYWISENDATAVAEVLEKYRPFQAVVVKCLNKKVVSPALIKKLAADKEISKLPWYISTKDWKPQWFQDISNVNCRMLLIPQMAVDAAKLKKDTTKWINNKGFGTQNALEEINNFRSSLNKQNPSEKPVVIILPYGHRILSVGYGEPQQESKRNKPQIYEDLLIVQNERETFTKPMPIETSFASIFLGAFIAQDLEHLATEDKKSSKPDTKKFLEKALMMTREFVRSENSRVLDPEEWDPKKNEVRFDMSSSDKPDGKFDWKFNTSLKVARERWKKATKELGVIERDDNQFLELFRAATEVDDYICIDPDKKNALQGLVIELKKFRDSTRERSCSCKITAPPGSGKTRLANKLARAEGFNFLQFNLTHLYAREQLLDVFDKISTEQAKRPEEPLLVFIDEINAQLNQDYFYSAFLTPLEDGIYVRAEKIFHIEPCFWLFAGTETKNDSESGLKVQEKNKTNPDIKGLETVDKGKNKGENKWSDLRSRLTLPNINLTQTNPDIKGLETVYIGVSMMVSTFPDVRWVSKKILILFWLLGRITNPVLSMRQLVQFIRSFYDIQRGRVTSANVHIEWLDMQKVKWANEKEKTVWRAAKDLNVIDDIPETEKKTNSELWMALPEGDDVKIEL